MSKGISILIAVLFLLLQSSSQRASEKRIVFEEECFTNPLYGNDEIKQFVRDYLKRAGAFYPPEIKNELSVFICDINDDSIPEYFVCPSGGSGGASLYLFADSPPRFLGEFFAYRMWFDISKGKWPVIHTFARMGFGEGYVETYEICGTQYSRIDKFVVYETVDGSAHEISDLEKKVGKRNCG